MVPMPPRRMTSPEARPYPPPEEWTPPMLRQNIARTEGPFLSNRPYSDSISTAGLEDARPQSSAAGDRPRPFGSPQASPVSLSGVPASSGGASSPPPVSRTISNEFGQGEQRSRMATRPDVLQDGRSVSLAVPYANTKPSARPTVGGRPLQPNSNIGGVPKHERTMTPANETTAAKSGKRALNLLNPVNLLMRRRSNVPQAAQPEQSNARILTVPPMTLPDNYDPRIRGSVVHDFSAPRTRRGSANIRDSTHQSSRTSDASYENPLLSDANAARRPVSSGNAEPRRTSQHSAVFREVLDDNTTDQNRLSAVHAESLANHKFLQRVSRQSQGSNDLASMPNRLSDQADFQSFRRSIGDWQARLSDPSIVSGRTGVSALSNTEAERRVSHYSPVSPSPSSKDRSSNALSGEELLRLSQASLQAAEPRSSHTTVQSQDQPVQEPEEAPASNLPKHVKSNASRFSFQLAGNENAVEERLLEERAKHKRGASDPMQPVIPDEDEDYFDEDAMYDADELEGMCEDSEMFGGLAHQELSTTDKQHAPDAIGEHIPSSPPAMPKPENTFAIQPNANVSQYLEYQRSQAKARNEQDYVVSNVGEQPTFETEDVDDLDSKRTDSHQALLSPPIEAQNEYRRSRQSHDFDDDFYFNDGTINMEPDTGSSLLDEGIDEEGLFGSDGEEEVQSRKRPQIDTDAIARAFQTSHNNGVAFELNQTIPSIQSPEQGAVDTHPPPPSQQSTSPVSDRIAAYHLALAEAAHKAAAEGRFSRATSTATSQSKYSHSQRSLGSQRSARQEEPGMSRNPSSRVHQIKHAAKDSYSGFDFGFNDPSTVSTSTPESATFPVNAFTTVPTDDAEDDDALDAMFDDLANDDAIISEANADALASDEEGFYGSEFGFYAKARPGSAGEAQCINGGFFGAPGGSTIERQWSLKEPNLTPITERSEFSARNSLIGGPFSPLASNPAFAAQLARMSPLALAQLQEDVDDPVTLEQMLRLRNLAFTGTEGTGRSGSISSLSSAAGFPGHPLSHRGSWTTAAMGAQFAHRGSGMGSVPLVPQVSSSDSNRSSGVRMSRSHSDLFWSEGIRPGSQNYSPVADSPVSSHSTRFPWTGMGGAGAGDFDPSTPRKSGGEVGGSPLAPATAVRVGPRAHGQGYGKGHVRTGSGDRDSVTYVKEKDEEGRDRWILERRRMSEAGSMELVGREMLEGARI